MSKPETKTTDTGKAGEPAALTDKELDAITGGASPELFQVCATGRHMPSGHEKWIELNSMQW
jgi:bacteriocin-like protein